MWGEAQRISTCQERHVVALSFKRSPLKVDDSVSNFKQCSQCCIAVGTFWSVVRRRYSWMVTELFCWALGWLHYLQCVGRYYKSLSVILSYRQKVWRFVIAHNHCEGQSLPIFPWKNPNIIVHIPMSAKLQNVCRPRKVGSGERN